MTIGVLALQGDFSLHLNVLNKLKVCTVLVKKTTDFDSINGLIIPGGESTVMSLLIDKFNLYKKIKDFAINNCVYGTCAGAILVSSECDDKKINTLNLIKVKSLRNFYGRQVNSFSKKININFLKNKINASFIRAPKLTSLSKKNKILAHHENNPVLLQYKNILVSSFHPELSSSTIIHEYFIKMIKNNV